MSSAISVSQRIWVPALLVAVLLLTLVLANSGVGAQGLCEYVTVTTVCVRPLALMRVVQNANACTDREEPAYLVNEDFLKCALTQRGSQFSADLDAETAARMAADADLEARIEALEALHSSP